MTTTPGPDYDDIEDDGFVTDPKYLTTGKTTKPPQRAEEESQQTDHE